MAKKTESEKFLLILAYPACSFPIGLFDTAEEAVKYAADYPPPHADDLGRSNDLGDRYGEQVWLFEDLGASANRVPNGYVIQKFVGNRPTLWANVEPYNDRSAVLPGNEKANEIDPEQELDWN